MYIIKMKVHVLEKSIIFQNNLVLLYHVFKNNTDYFVNQKGGLMKKSITTLPIYGSIFLL